MKVLDLFSGIGGFSLGLERAGMETVAFCEIDESCREKLTEKWPGTPAHKDIRDLNGRQYRDSVDLVCGGYPCQPFSTAGLQGGTKDDRHLWPEMFRVIREVGPRWVVAENVAGHISMGLDDVLSDLEAENYTCWPFVIPACAVGHRQRRDRVWILAHSMQGHRQVGRDVPRGGWEPEQIQGHGIGEAESEPPMVEVVDGLPPWMDELRGYGNAVVPQIPEIIGKAIIEYEVLAMHKSVVNQLEKMEGEE